MRGRQLLLQLFKPPAKLIQRKRRKLWQTHVPHSGAAAQRIQPLAAARAARRMKEIPLHPLSVAALFLQTPPKHRFHALKPALRDSFRHGYIRKRFLQRRAGSSLIQHCLLQIAVCFDCRPRLYREPIMPQSRIKRTRLVFSVFLCPKTHSAILQRTPLIHRPRSVHLECLAKPLTFRTCPFFGVIYPCVCRIHSSPYRQKNLRRAFPWFQSSPPRKWQLRNADNCVPPAFRTACAVPYKCS